MTILQALVLGLIQGVTEILPVSSSAHLVIVPWLFRWDYQGLVFDVALHLGTALAFAVYFFKDWVELLKSAFTGKAAYPKGFFFYLIAATVPAAIAGLFFEKYAESVFRSPWVIACALFIFSVVLWLAERYSRKSLSLRDVKLPMALFIGIAQALALVPGVSRSGITITAGLFAGFSREAAAKFSFLIATPIVLAAAFLSLSKINPQQLNTQFFTGMASSAVSGYIAIALLLSYVRKYSFNIFVIYRILLALLMVVLLLSGKPA